MQENHGKLDMKQVYVLATKVDEEVYLGIKALAKKERTTVSSYIGGVLMGHLMREGITITPPD